ncbi:hypothetical protein HMI56_004529 [Coelomomyces lativittatus]|nr:hypothetical protein HMI56_004529 [Coelomomyces lativittatus]
MNVILPPKNPTTTTPIVPPPVVNVPNADTTKNDKHTSVPPKIQTTTTPIVPPPVVNVPKADTTKNDINTSVPPKIQTTTTPIVPPTVVNVKGPNFTKIDTKAPLPPKNTHVPIVSFPAVNDKRPWHNTFGPPRLYNQRRNTQRNGVQPVATNPKKNEQIKSQPNSPSPDTLNTEALLKERKKAIRDAWRSGRKIDLEKLGLGLPGKFSAASATSKPNATRNLMKRQVGQKRFYDIAFTLGRMVEITNPRHAEHYIADVVNMLQWYYKKFYFNGFSVRLSGAHYLLQHKTLIDFQGLPQKDKVQYYHGVWRNHALYSMPFQTYDQKFLLARRPSGTGIFSHGIADLSLNYCHRNYMRGITFIRDESVTNPYELVTTLVHEIGHATGISHEDERGCKYEGYVMESSRPNFRSWYGFSACTLKKLRCTPQ